MAELYGNRRRRIGNGPTVMLQSRENLAQRKKCWKEGNLPKVRKLNIFAHDLTGFA